MKIINLDELNKLEQMSRIMLNHNIDNDFYNYYMFNDINWLIENQEKIINDYESNKFKCIFDILINQNILDKTKILNKVISIGKDELKKYIDSSFNIDEVYSSLINIKYDYKKLNYFERVRIR